jgi:thiamine pyrophosphate-dependent acetolactate synthase large subunit-like protein
MWGKGHDVATELGMVHYERAAEGLGAYGELVERAEDIGPAMKRALGCGHVACLNIVTDPDVIEPGTLALYSAMATTPRRKETKPDEGPGGGTTLPYYGKRDLE